MQNIFLKSVLIFIGQFIANLAIRSAVVYGLAWLLIPVAGFDMPMVSFPQVAILCLMWTIISLKASGFKAVLSDVIMKVMQSQEGQPKMSGPIKDNGPRPIIGFGRPSVTDKKE